jgi:sulfur relay (sulfurtransferase) complex TusBCD TusD component (DsrE family)
MAKYLLIESRDPFDSNDVASYYELAAGLVKEGNEVTLFLVQNGVLTARKSTRSDALVELGKAGVQILADDFSLKERGIGALVPGVAPSAIDVVIDQLAEGRKVIWH